MRWTSLLFLLCLASSSALAGGIEFFHGSWEEALEQAKTQDKVIFVDAYTTWCGPCKRMAKTVFTQEEVGEFYNSNFICMKIDMEKEMGLRFQEKYPVAAFPTLYYIDGNGEVVHRTKGARNANQFIELGRTVIGKTDNSGDYAKKYEEGDRDPELIYKYVKALNKAGKPSLKISNDYLKSQKDLNTPFNLRFIYEATIEADSRIFSLLIKHRSAIEELEGKDKVASKIKAACKKTAQKAIEYESADLHQEATDKMKAHLGNAGAALAMEMDMNYFRTRDDVKNYLKVCNTYVKKKVKNDAKQLHFLAKDIKMSFSTDSKAMKYAEKLAKKAAQNGGLYNYYYTYAEILFHNGKKKEALNMANEALERAEEEKGARRGILALIQKIQQA